MFLLVQYLCLTSVLLQPAIYDYKKRLLPLYSWIPLFLLVLFYQFYINNFQTALINVLLCLILQIACFHKILENFSFGTADMRLIIFLFFYLSPSEFVLLLLITCLLIIIVNYGSYLFRSKKSRHRQLAATTYPFVTYCFSACILQCLINALLIIQL